MKTILRTTLVLVLVIGLNAIATATDRWNQFRGPASDAHAIGPETPMQWSDTENVRWKVAIPGLGWSSPVLIDGRLFVTTAVKQGDGLSLRTISLDSADGKVLWDTEVRQLDKAPAIHSKNSHASPTPIFHNGMLYVHFGAHGTAALNADSGKLQWLCTELDYPPVHGCGGSPVLHDGKLFVVCDGSKNPFVAAIDAATGKIAWRTQRSVEARISHSFVTPIIAQVDGKPQLFAPGPDHFAAYDPSTGKELWKVKAPGWSVVPQPTVTHGMVIYNHDYDNPELMAVKLGGSGDVTDSHVVWRLKKGAPSTPSPLLVGDELYVVSDTGIASCIDVLTGKTHWVERLGGNYSASPVYSHGRVLFMDENGKAIWVRASKKFEELAKCEVPGRTFATPAFGDGAMYLRTDEHLYKITSMK